MNGEPSMYWYAYNHEEMKGVGSAGIFYNDKYEVWVRFYDNGELEEYYTVVSRNYDIKKFTTYKQFLIFFTNS